jgi:hypothetical protein
VVKLLPINVIAVQILVQNKRDPPNLSQTPSDGKDLEPSPSTLLVEKASGQALRPEGRSAARSHAG